MASDGMLRPLGWKRGTLFVPMQATAPGAHACLPASYPCSKVHDKFTSVADTTLRPCAPQTPVPSLACSRYTSPDLGGPQLSSAFRPPDHTTRYIMHMLGCLKVALHVEPHKERSSRHAPKMTWQLLHKRCWAWAWACWAPRCRCPSASTSSCASAQRRSTSRCAAGESHSAVHAGSAGSEDPCCLHEHSLSSWHTRAPVGAS